MPNYRVLAIRKVIRRVAANDGTLRLIKWLTAELSSDIALLHHLSLAMTETLGNPACHSRLSSPSDSQARQMPVGFLHRTSVLSKTVSLRCRQMCRSYLT